MKVFSFKSTGLLIGGLFAALSIQSCNKESESIAPNAITNDVVSTAPVCKQVSLVAGQHTLAGNVSVGVATNGDLQVTYNVTQAGVYLSETHLDLFTDVNQFKKDKKISGGGAIPGKFAFKQSFSNGSRTTSYTAVIPASYVNALGSDCFFVAAHAALSNGETAWGGLSRPTSNGRVSLDVSKQFPGNNWSVYFEFCKSECDNGVDFTYAWEDLQSAGNDSDYNDLVVQSNIVKSATEMKINFLLTARGAAFQHKFRFKIPKAGITGIFGAPSYTEDATYYYITVFESTRAPFPSDYANVALGEPCAPFANTEVVLTLDNTFTYNPAVPYEPYLSVFYNGLTIPAYDLYIYEVSGRDTWTDTDGKVYPNGIVIPSDWRWPLERVNIRQPYPNFTSLTEGFTPNWASNLAQPALTFDKTACQ